MLQALRLAGETTRVDLARTTGLTAPTIANITKRLSDNGLIMQLGRRQGGRGQPAVRLAINPDGCYAIGLNIDRDHLTMVIIDLAGTVRARHVREVAFALPAAVQTFVSETLPMLLTEGGIDRARVLGVGVALPDDLGRIALPRRPDRYDEWEGLDVAALIGEVMPWPVRVDNDAASAALGEAQLGHGINLPSFFYLLVSAGLGGGLVIDRHYCRGADARSGEIGLMPDANRGDGAIVQETVSLSALYARLEDSNLPAGGVGDLADPSPEAEAVIARWLDDAAQALLRPLIAVNCLINPDAVVIGGRLPAAIADALVERLNSIMQDSNLPAIAPIRRADNADDAPAIGAAIMPLLDHVLPSDSILMQAGRG